MGTDKLLQQIKYELEELQAIDIVTLDVKHLTVITDYMVVCSGKSTRHVKALADNLLEKLKQQHITALNQSGTDNNEWALLDLNGIIVHIMLPQVRAFYNLEGLWDDKPRDSLINATD